LQTLSQLHSGALKGIKKLTLSENLLSFPLDILSLADSLEVLDLSNNQLSELPEALAQLPKLKILFASNNRFTQLPEVLGCCDQLEMVVFKSNQIDTVSENALPPKLRWFVLTDNQVHTLPDALGERTRLQKLALAGNRITALPQTMAQLSNLELIRISANQLSECPEQLLDLPKLAWFAFAGNPFSQSVDDIPDIPELSSSSYTLQDILGQGASGVISSAIWNAPQNDFPDKIAVKVFKGEVTSDGYPKDELAACLKTGNHPNLVQSLAQVKEESCLALIMNLIPTHYRNLGQPPSLSSCTRDTFPEGFTLSIKIIDKIASQIKEVFIHLHTNKVCHGDLYTHNTLYDALDEDNASIVFGDFGAASMYHMLTEEQQTKIQAIERRALNYFIGDLLSICATKDKESERYQRLLADVVQK
jgi:hypothetical protein